MPLFQRVHCRRSWLSAKKIQVALIILSKVQYRQPNKINV